MIASKRKKKKKKSVLDFFFVFKIKRQTLIVSLKIRGLLDEQTIKTLRGSESLYNKDRVVIVSKDNVLPLFDFTDCVDFFIDDYLVYFELY
jgi:hypothetical protein